MRVENLPDDCYEFDESRQQMVGRRSGRTFSLGEPIKVRLDSVSVQRRRLELSIAGSAPVRGGPLEKGDLRRTHPPARRDRNRKKAVPERREREGRGGKPPGGKPAGGKRGRRR